MRKLLLLLFLCTVFYSCEKPSNEKQDKAAVIAVLRAQEKAWSQHDIEGYMKGYWNSDSLKFYRSDGSIAYGWDTTLSNYKKNYPTVEHTGTLKFKVNDITRIENESYYVMGEYHLTRKVGNANGVFLIIFKKFDGEWKVVADLTP